MIKFTYKYRVHPYKSGIIGQRNYSCGNMPELDNGMTKINIEYCIKTYLLDKSSAWQMAVCHVTRSDESRDPNLFHFETKLYFF